MTRRHSRYNQRKTIFDGLPVGSVSSLQEKLASLKRSRADLLSTRPHEQNELIHIATQLFFLAKPAILLISPMRTELSTISEFSVIELSRFLAALDETLAGCLRARSVLQRKLDFARRVGFFIPKTALHLELLLEDQISTENALLRVKETFNRNKTAIDRLSELNSRLCNLSEVEGAISRFERALDRELAKPESEMDILRARVAEAAKENREVAARMRSRIPRTERCPYCMVTLGEQNHVDHIVPVAHGGRPLKWNLVRICIPCNLKKRDMTLLEYATKYRLDYLLIASRLQDLGKRP